MITQTAVDLIDLGSHVLEQGEVALARRMYEESLTIWRALDDAAGIAHSLERLRRLEGKLPSTTQAGARRHSAFRAVPLTGSTTTAARI